MKTIKNSKEITTLEVGDVVVFGNLEYVVNENFKLNSRQYYLYNLSGYNGIIFEILNFKKRDFVENLGIDANCNVDFPETTSLEALTAIVSALFKEYEKQNELPKTWEEFCERNLIKEGECFVSQLSIIQILNKGAIRNVSSDKNLCTSKQEAEAFLALMQLRQLRKCYISDWEPNWTDGTTIKYCISLRDGYLEIQSWQRNAQNLSFPSYNLAHKFLTNFKDLLEVAKSLL